MTDKVQKIREEVARLKEETSIGLSEHENGVEQGRMEIINALSLFLDSLQEEPVSDDSVKCTSKIILEGTNFNKSWYAHPELAFKAGAKWQLRKTRYEKDENNKK